MEWTELEMYAADKDAGAARGYRYWISGIYKIVQYNNAPCFHAFFIPGHYNNWGDHVCTPPDYVSDVRIANRYAWASLESAKRDCQIHADTHTPKPKTVKRAAEILAEYIVDPRHKVSGQIYN